MSGHALLSPSSSSRWISCPPSAKLNENDDTGSTYAQQGTDAHTLCEYKVLKALGNDVDDPTEGLEYYDEEMAECTDAYCEFVMEQLQASKQSCPDPIVLVEQRLDFSRWVPESFGTADCVIVADDVMTVIDFKYGLGVLVEAENNSQMKMYALGALNLFESLYEIKKVRMIIFQPRRDNISIAEITTDKLVSWANDTLIPAAYLAAKGAGEYMAGKHCQFCSVKATCRKRAEYNLQLAQYDFAVPDTLSDNEISMVLERAETFIGWVNDVKDYALEKAIGGKSYPGFKLVEGRSNRRYISDDAVVTPHIYFTQFMDDEIPEERNTAIFMNRVLLSKCVELWVFGNVISRGMKGEIKRAMQEQLGCRDRKVGSFEGTVIQFGSW